MNARLRDGSSIEFRPEPFNSGGEKVVFWSADGQRVVGLYRQDICDYADRRSRLDKVLGTFNPTWGSAHAEFWAEHFCWPTALLDAHCGIPSAFLRAHHLHDPPLGLVAPVYPSNFFFYLLRGNQKVEKNSRWFTRERSRQNVPEDELGNLPGSLRVCTKIARAVAHLHQSGIAHADLSHRNVLIDPRGGDARIIDIDSLVIPGIMPPTVLGTPGYIAPEVLTRKASPGILSDCHSLAVLIYEILLLRHPLDGPKVHDSDPERDEILANGEKALFIEHPTDRSNAPRPKLGRPFSAVGPPLAGLIQRAFVDGLHQPNRRPAATEWAQALYRTFDLLHPGSRFGEWLLVAPGAPLQFPESGDRLKGPIPIAYLYREVLPKKFVYERHWLTIYHHLQLRKWHTTAHHSPGPGADRSPKGYFARESGKWWLVNQSGAPFYTVDGPAIPHGEAVQLVSGLRLRTDGEPAGRLLAFDFLQT